MSVKRILLIGRWGKTHAFAKAIVEKSPQTTELYCYMDKPNAGIVALATDYMLGDMKDNQRIIDYAKKNEVDFVLAVPHMSLCNSLIDDLIRSNIRCIGPTKNCSRLETSKSFLRQMLKETGQGHVSPEYRSFSNKEDALDHIRSIDHDVAVKPAGVTEGDGVKVVGMQLKDRSEAEDYISEIFDKNIGGIAELIIEEKLEGKEFTIQAFVNGETIVGMPATQDYKLLREGDEGLNTPGMGSVSLPNHLLPFLSGAEYEESKIIMQKVVKHLTDKYNEVFVGFLSGQFIKTGEGIKVIEFNVRPGDSEILNIIPILKTDFVEICEAMIDNRLSTIDIAFDKKATVCKYIVSKGFPHPKEDMYMEINEEAIKRAGADLFYSCFSVGKNTYKPSPRGVAVTAKGDTIEEAYQLCEKMLDDNIKGKDIWHRRDIGKVELLKKNTWE
ncbi:MAG: phosphoribosylamine--glycine ligase [Candidatus Delongbacteria bacterium]